MKKRKTHPTLADAMFRIGIASWSFNRKLYGAKTFKAPTYRVSLRKWGSAIKLYSEEGP